MKKLCNFAVPSKQNHIMGNIPSQQLDDEVSFKLYALNRLIQQAYQTYLVPLGITYPQYLVMKILMEQDGCP